MLALYFFVYIKLLHPGIILKFFCTRLKAEKMEKLVGFPKELLDMDLIWDTFYKKVEISPTTFLENGLNMAKESREWDISKLREKVERLDWRKRTYVAEVNAYYSPVDNGAIIPAGFLQGIVFSSSRPEYMNYGAVGFVIGHEITHGFDDQGSQTDEKGCLVDWWRPETKTK